MGLQSMTGFGRAAADHDGTAIAWELKSVNGTSVEARLRMPPGLERLEQPVRQAIQRRFSRGNIQAVLTLAGGHATNIVRGGLRLHAPGKGKQSIPITVHLRPQAVSALSYLSHAAQSSVIQLLGTSYWCPAP